MSPSQYYTKKEISPFDTYPSHSLKINKDSHYIQKSPSSASASASASVTAPTLTKRTQPRQPIIIYTHSPKVIHTNPNDFMALVQKLTGLSKPDGNPDSNPKKESHGSEAPKKNGPKVASSDDSDSSVVTEDCYPSTIFESVNFNSCSSTMPMFYPNTYPCFNNIPMFTPNDYLYPTNPFFDNYADQLLLMPNMRSTTSSSTNMEALQELHEF